jgi:hypothetical protein
MERLAFGAQVAHPIKDKRARPRVAACYIKTGVARALVVDGGSFGVVLVFVFAFLFGFVWSNGHMAASCEDCDL